MLFAPHMSHVERAAFAKMLAVLFRSGVPINETLDIIERQAPRRARRAIVRITQSVRDGTPLHQAFGRYPSLFPNLFVSLVRAGEMSGTLDETFERLATHFQKEYEARRKVITASLYPLLVLGGAVALSFVLAFFVFPRLLPVFRGLGTDLPLITKILIWVVERSVRYGVVFGFAFVAVVFGSLWVFKMRFVQRFTHPIILRTPLAGPMIRSMNLATVLRTLGILLKSGVPVDQSITLVQETVGNVAYQTDCARILERIQQGNSIGTTLSLLSQSRWPLLVTQMIQTGEKTGKLEETLYYLADFYDGAVDESTKRFIALLEPLLIFGIGLVVGTIALAIIGPIYNLSSSIHQ